MQRIQADRLARSGAVALVILFLVAGAAFAGSGLLGPNDPSNAANATTLSTQEAGGNQSAPDGDCTASAACASGEPTEHPEASQHPDASHPEPADDHGATTAGPHESEHPETGPDDHGDQHHGTDGHDAGDDHGEGGAHGGGDD